MSGTHVSVLTPAGAGAIAAVEVAGPDAWDAARRLFRPAGKQPLPEQPEPHCFWFGRFGEGPGDEVILAVKQTAPEPVVEIHCHGGRKVVRWVVEQLQAACGFAAGAKPQAASDSAADLLPFAPTLRTASILLDQVHGAFDRDVRHILSLLDARNTAEAAPLLAQLASFAPVGRHLVEPWKVVVAGPPNVGKSSLVNALAGYQRAVVSELPGTTRDVVTVPVAFDGWPVELADTAGLRRAAGLEAEGIERAERFIRDADLVLWVMDATAEPIEASPRSRSGLVVNKTDQPPTWDLDCFPDAIRVSALTGEGIPGLAAEIARRLVPQSPPPGSAIPFTPRLANLIEAAHAALAGGRPDEAARLLRDALPPG